MKAHFMQHAFSRHSHETYSIGLTQSGVQAFHCAGELHASRPGDLILFNPDAAHDGQRGAKDGFGYSILYVPEEIVMSCATDPDAGLRLPRHFRRPVARDPSSANLYELVVDATSQPCESLRKETLLRKLLVVLLQRHGNSDTRTQPVQDAGTARMRQVRDYLEQNFASDISGLDIAGLVGLSRVHMTRAFTRHFGVPPHVHLNTVRLRRARDAMLRGDPLADVAAACGFADQAHFSRRFKGAVGISPSQWLKEMTREAGRESGASGREHS